MIGKIDKKKKERKKKLRKDKWKTYNICKRKKERTTKKEQRAE